MPAKRKGSKKVFKFPLNKLLIAAAVLIVLSIALVFTALKSLSIKNGLYEKVFFSAPSGYTVKNVRAVNFGIGEYYSVILTPKARSSLIPPQVWIYKYSNKRFNLLTKFAPTFNVEEIEYPDVPLDFISDAVINYSGEKKQALFIRWGVTGADFFGVYPTIITLDGIEFNFIPAYPKELKEESLLKASYSILPLTIFDKNDPERKTDTYGIMDYLNQGNSLVAEFLGTENCKACASPKRVDVYVLSAEGVVYNPEIKGIYYLDENSDVDKFVKDLNLSD